MRVLVLALAILLLPLRGWLGDAMALAPVQPAAAAHAGHTMQAGDDHSMHDMAGAPGMTHVHDVDVAPPEPRTAADCQSTCTSCQLCHSVALTVWPALLLLGEAPREAPAFEPVSFASAEPARGLKPPIS